MRRLRDNNCAIKGEIAVVNAAFDARCVVFVIHLASALGGRAFAQKKKGKKASLWPTALDVRLHKSIIATWPSFADYVCFFIENGCYARHR